MAKTEDSWVREQLTNAKTKRAVGTAVLKLLDTWNEIVITEENAKDAIEKFGKLSLGHAIVEEKVDQLKGTWVQAQPGQLKVTAGDSGTAMVGMPVSAVVIVSGTFFVSARK